MMKPKTNHPKKEYRLLAAWAERTAASACSEALRQAQLLDPGCTAAQARPLAFGSSVWEVSIRATYLLPFGVYTATVRAFGTPLSAAKKAAEKAESLVYPSMMGEVDFRAALHKIESEEADDLKAATRLARELEEAAAASRENTRRAAFGRQGGLF